MFWRKKFLVVVVVLYLPYVKHIGTTWQRAQKHIQKTLCPKFQDPNRVSTPHHRAGGVVLGAWCDVVVVLGASGLLSPEQDGCTKVVYASRALMQTEAFEHLNAYTHPPSEKPNLSLLCMPAARQKWLQRWPSECATRI